MTLATRTLRLHLLSTLGAPFAGAKVTLQLSSYQADESDIVPLNWELTEDPLVPGDYVGPIWPNTRNDSGTHYDMLVQASGQQLLTELVTVTVGTGEAVLKSKINPPPYPPVYGAAKAVGDANIFADASGESASRAIAAVATIEEIAEDYGTVSAAAAAAKAAADQTEIDADLAKTSSELAQEALAAALVAGNIFNPIAAALAVTPVDSPFWVEPNATDGLTRLTAFMRIGPGTTSADYRPIQDFARGSDLDARTPVGNGTRYAHAFVDSLGHAAGGITPEGVLEMLGVDTQELSLQTMNLTPDARGVLLQISDSQGRVAFRVKEDGTVEFAPNLRAFDGPTLVSSQVGAIEFGDNLAVSPTPRGIRVDASGGGSTEAGSLSSLNQGVSKLDDPATWVDRTLVLQAGVSLTPGSSGSASVLGFRVVKMTHLEAPIAPYYAYYSTDHAAGEGGVFLATASHPFGPWTPQGRVFYDASATQTETPEVVWDRWSGLYRMYYQVQNAKYGPGDTLSAIGSQSTLSAYSTDGVTWTKDPNFILDQLATNQYADGHTGYFYLSETPDGFVGRSALGGGSVGLTTIWRHQGGTMGGRETNGHIHNNWYSDYRDVGSNYEATYGTPQEGRRAMPFGAFGYNLRGARMGIGQCWYRRSGTEPADVIVVAGPITNDYRRFMGMPTPIWTPEEAWETQDVRFTNTFVDDGYIYVFLSMNTSGVPTAPANVIGGFRHVV